MACTCLEVALVIVQEFADRVGLVERVAGNDNVVNIVFVIECLYEEVMGNSPGVDDINNFFGNIWLDALRGGLPCELFHLLLPAVADLSGLMAEVTQLTEQADVRLVPARGRCQALGRLDEKDAHLLHRERITVEGVWTKSLSVGDNEVGDESEETRVVQKEGDAREKGWWMQTEDRIEKARNKTRSADKLTKNT